jgi:hypothetical protein
MNLISTNFYDHIVHGEGEQVLLDVLHHIEQHEPVGSKILSRNIASRLDLDSLPFPDYSDYDMSDYVHPGGMSAEISRGCIAKCVFCTEVHFWKYRGRLSDNLLNEIQHQHDTYGLDFVWFIDSLVNGNLNELRAFCLGVVERGLEITWQGYARCDGRMDSEYFRDLRKSGCIQLSYGIESGSQTLNLEIRKNTLSWLNSNDPEAAWIYQRLTDAVNTINAQFWEYRLDYIEVLQYTIYNQLDDHYHGHVDMMLSGLHHRKLSFSLQLDDPATYEGCDLETETGYIHFIDRRI